MSICLFKCSENLSAWGKYLFWGDSLHCLVFLISDSHRVVDLANLKRRYNRCPNLYPFDVTFGWPVTKDGGL